MSAARARVLAVVAASCWLAPHAAHRQTADTPSLLAGSIAERIVLDGVLAEGAWTAADAAGAFLQTDPAEGAAPSARTTVRVLADTAGLVIGILCEDSDPDGVVSFSVRRDA
ncbi:MAG: hypothetical protein HY824_16955 [Acidobacteria bacterium]|nr:hypothetical protein [Acidobacteriota bacterium]